MSADYRALEATLAAQQAARVLSPELMAAMLRSPVLSGRRARIQALELLRQMTPVDRDEVLIMLQEWEERDARETVMLDDLWQCFGDETDRQVARDYWERGMSLEGIAAGFGFVYNANVTVEMIAVWQQEDHWPVRTP